jgi:hypothetical protein
MNIINKLKNKWSMHAGQLVKRSDLYYVAATTLVFYLFLNNC